jgi:hypothetical protein
MVFLISKIMISWEAAREIAAQVERITPEIDALLAGGLKGAEMNSCSNPTNGGIRSKTLALRNITSTKTGVRSTNPAPLSLYKMEEPKNVIEFAHALGIALYDWQDPAIIALSADVAEANLQGFRLIGRKQ